MTDQSPKASISQALTHWAVLWWFASLFFFVPAAQWLDWIILIFGFMVLPIVILAIWLAGLPLWALSMTAVRLWKKQWLEALGYFAILPIGVAVAFAGLKFGDLLAIATYGPLLKDAVRAVEEGAPIQHAGGLSASSVMAFKLTGGWLDISVGIAYDKTGQADRMMSLAPFERAADWQKNAVDVMACQGGARHLFDKFYRITVSSYSC